MMTVFGNAKQTEGSASSPIIISYVPLHPAGLQKNDHIKSGS